jgi:hypothetical protein
MATIKIDLPGQQAAALSAQAAAQGLILADWFQKIAANTPARGTSPIDWSQCPAVESVPGKTFSPSLSRPDICSF